MNKDITKYIGSLFEPYLYSLGRQLQFKLTKKRAIDFPKFHTTVMYTKSHIGDNLSLQIDKWPTKLPSSEN